MNLIEKLELFLESKNNSNRLMDHFRDNYSKYALGSAATSGIIGYLNRKNKEEETKKTDLMKIKKEAWKQHQLEKKQKLLQNNRDESSKMIKHLKDDDKDKEISQPTNSKHVEDFLNKNVDNHNIGNLRKINDIVDDYKDEIKNGTNFVIKQFAY